MTQFLRPTDPLEHAGSAQKLPLYFYRDRVDNEIDMLIEESGTPYPIEIKKHADPDKLDVSKFYLLDKLPTVKHGPGGVVCMADCAAY